MTMRKLFKNKVNRLTLLFVVTIIIITSLLSFSASSLYYVNTHSMVNNMIAESTKNNQSTLVKNFSSFERDLNKTTNQLLNSRPIYNIVSGFSLSGDLEIKNTINELHNFLSPYVGLKDFFIINMTTKKVYNRTFSKNADTALYSYISYDDLLKQHNDGRRVFTSPKYSTSILFNTHDFRGFLVVYVFDKGSLLNNFDDLSYDLYNTAIYYKNNLVFSSGENDFSEIFDEKISEQEHIFLYTKDNYTVVTDAIPKSLKSFYHSFVKQMIAFTAFILLLGIIAIVVSEKVIDKKTEEYTNSLLSHSRQHHYTAIKSIIQQSIRNQYIAPDKQQFLDDYFQKIEFEELYCFCVQLDNINSLLLSSSYKDIAVLMKKIMLIFENKLSKFGTCIIIDIDFDTMGIIVASKKTSLDEEIIDNIQFARDDIDKALSVTVTIAIAEVIESSADIPYSFFQLQELIKYRFFTGYNSTIFDSIELNNNTSYPTQLQNQITSHFIAHNTEEFSASLKKFFIEAQTTDCDEAKKWVINLVLALSKCSGLTNNSADIISELSTSDTLENQFEIFMKYFINTNNHPDEATIANDTFLEKTNSIIEEEYSNLDFNLSRFSDLLNISGVYAGQKFKKVFNKSFNTYLAEYRVQKAIEFLNNQDYKISEIANMCGFSSSGYFIKTFKKITSMTPTEYRSNLFNK